MPQITKHIAPVSDQCWSTVHDSGPPLNQHGAPSHTLHWINVGFTLAQRLRHWTNVKTTLIQRFVSAGFAYFFVMCHNSPCRQPVWNCGLCHAHPCWPEGYILWGWILSTDPHCPMSPVIWLNRCYCQTVTVLIYTCYRGEHSWQHHQQPEQQ